MRALGLLHIVGRLAINMTYSQDCSYWLKRSGAELINRADVRSTTAFVLGFSTVFVLAFSYFLVVCCFSHYFT